MARMRPVPVPRKPPRGAQPGRSRAPDCFVVQSQVPGGVVGRRRRLPARERIDRAQRDRRRQRAHGLARGTRKRAQRPLRHAVAGAARLLARLVEDGARRRQDPARRMVVPRTESRRPARGSDTPAATISPKCFLPNLTV